MNDQPNPPSADDDARSRGFLEGKKPYRPDLGVGKTVPELGVAIDEILLRCDTYLIFVDENGDLQWLIDEMPAGSAWALPRVADLEARCDFFKQAVVPMYVHIFRPFLRKWKGLNASFANSAATASAISAKRHIGQGLAVLFSPDGTKAEAEAAFASAQRFIEQRGRELSLVWLYSTFGFLAVLSIVALLRLVFGEDQQDVRWAVLSCAAAGGIGAYISRALASRTDLPCDANAGWYLHVQEALLRWSVGVVAGGLMCLLVGGKVLLGGLGADGLSFPAVLALATISGMSERFLPTLLNRFDDQVGSDGGNKKNGKEKTDGTEGK